jgi:hypothetical protein
VLKVIPKSYQNEAKRIYIPGLAPGLIPGSPEDIKIPVPASGVVSPLPGSGLASPAEHAATPAAKD